MPSRVEYLPPLPPPTYLNKILIEHIENYSTRAQVLNDVAGQWAISFKRAERLIHNHGIYFPRALCKENPAPEISDDRRQELVDISLRR